MSRIDMTAREWADLVKPVLPHVCSDADLPDLNCIRIEVTADCAYAVATDRYTLAAERHPLDGTGDDAVLHIRATEVKASLALFPYTKDYDPKLKITVDDVPFPVRLAGTDTSVRRLALTVEADDGTKLLMHDHRDPSRDSLASWRKQLALGLDREMTHAGPAVYLNAVQLGRWGAACRKGEALAVFSGAEGDDLLLILVEKHFAGVWKPLSYLAKPDVALRESPWRGELPEGGETHG